MKITRVIANARRRAFEVHTRGAEWTFPFSEVDPAPSRIDPMVEVFPDPELGREGFTYILRSGAEGSVHMDSVLEYNEDPAYLADLALYNLTTEARRRFDESPLSAREVARLLNTSPAQLYRLLDATNYNKSARQFMTLLQILGMEPAEMYALAE